MKTSPDFLFQLRIKCFINDKPIIINAFDRPCFDRTWSIDVEVRQGGKVIFPRGQLYCGSAVQSNEPQDGDAAKELVMSLVAMAPGDTDKEYFSDYTPEQLEWVEKYSYVLIDARMCRYCDSEGNPKK